MTHDTAMHIRDPDPPKGKLWSEYETAQLRILMGDNLSYEDIGYSLGRTIPSVKERWRWINQSEEVRKRRRERVNASRIVQRNGKARKTPTRAVYNTVMPADVFVERNQRINAPRTLSQHLMGDPAPGYSALDRKRQGLPA